MFEKCFKYNQTCRNFEETWGSWTRIEYLCHKGFDGLGFFFFLLFSCSIPTVNVDSDGDTVRDGPSLTPVI